MNLYEILEVNENASQDTINKIYKIQAKRYHPDLQQSEEEKRKAEIKMKQINDAYEILSNESKRKAYDEQLKQDRYKKEIDNMKDIEDRLKQKYNNLQSNAEMYRRQNNLNNQLNNEPNRRVYTKEDYIRDYNKRIRRSYFEEWKRKTILNLKVFGILTMTFLILLIFPPTRRMLYNIYNNNFFIKIIVNSVIEVLKTIVGK